MSYFSKIFHTGAIGKTPKRIIKRIVSEINFGSSSKIIEFGAGKGEITGLITANLEVNSLTKKNFYAFEIDDRFSSTLSAYLPLENIITANALSFEKYLPSDFMADYIISSIPLSFYSRSEISSLLDKMKNSLADNGKIIILFHAPWIIRFLKKQLPGAKLHTFSTLPPYFLQVYEKG